MRILVVEDTEDLAVMLVQMLEWMGAHDAATVTERFERLLTPEFWNEADVDVVVCDHMLGGPITGLDVCRWLHANRPEKPRRIVLTAAHISPEFAADLLDVCHRVLQKPTPIPELLEAVNG